MGAMGTVVVIARHDDRSALRVHAALGGRGHAVRLVTPEALALAPGWRRRSDDGETDAGIGLADGTRLDPGAGDVVLNRTVLGAVPQFARARAADRSYALAEMHALLLCWLADLPARVVNVASPRGLAGAERSLAEWLVLAHRAGFAARGMAAVGDGRRAARPGWLAHAPAGGGLLAPGEPVPRPALAGRVPLLLLEPLPAPPTRLVVVGGRVVPAMPEAVATCCRRLAAAAGVELLEIHCVPRDGAPPVFAAATVLPELDGEAAAAVADHLSAQLRAVRGAA
ncbi:MAG: hypothetical protein IT561_09100 [Alphaproteobacteria bacterium]|nr:hypothetical protein [Alphaproteobacteria bacterium]